MISSALLLKKARFFTKLSQHKGRGKNTLPLDIESL